jgi:hypothetical protein
VPGRAASHVCRRPVAALLRGPAFPLSIPILTRAGGPAVACDGAHMCNRRPASPPSCVSCFASGALGVLPGALRSPAALCARSPGLRRCLQPCPPARLRCLDVVPELVGTAAASGVMQRRSTVVRSNVRKAAAATGPLFYAVLFRSVPDRPYREQQQITVKSSQVKSSQVKMSRLPCRCGTLGPPD